MLSVEKPGSPSEILKHHGTKGMKWGVRKSSRDFSRQFPSNKERAAEIRKARARQGLRKEAFKSEVKGSQKRIDLKNTYLNNPDRATSLRLTRGEKAVLGLLAAGLVPVVAVPTAAIGVGVGIRVGKRRAAESRQRKG